jgi:hypothetical protein
VLGVRADKTKKGCIFVENAMLRLKDRPLFANWYSHGEMI